MVVGAIVKRASIERHYLKLAGISIGQSNKDSLQAILAKQTVELLI